MRCIDELDYEILLSNTSIKECADYIKKNFKLCHGSFVLRIKGKAEIEKLRSACM